MKEKLLKNQRDLFEFLCNRIDNQINKCDALMSVDIRPDVLFNANLVFEEVSDLCRLAEDLFGYINALTEENFFDGLDTPSAWYLDKLSGIFEQTRFYLEQEDLRARAAWYVDNNKIQENLRARINKQFGQLKGIAEASGFNISKAAQPRSSSQEQCQFDSHYIASKILTTALNYRNFPDDRALEIDQANHAIYLKHAKTRYEELFYEITKLNAASINFFDRTAGRQSEVYPALHGAKISQGLRTHTEKRDSLIKRYKALNPSFTLDKSHAIPIPPGLVAGKHTHFGRTPQLKQTQTAGSFAGVTESHQPPQAQSPQAKL